MVARVTHRTCSDGAALVGEQLVGSAPLARTWLALEQNGPWGAKAFTMSHLDPDLGRTLEQRAAGHEVRPALIRRPGPHADQHDPTSPRQVLIAHTVPGRTWLLEATVADPVELLDLDWAAAGAGDIDAVRRSLPTARPSDRSHLLVCTNGTRDVCCAVKGRPLALGVAALHAGVVWEVTHTSGHRFAPTAVVLPAGTLHGRLDVEAAAQVLTAADLGHTVVAGHRGRSTWPAAGQVAELRVRELVGESSLDALTVEVTTEGDHRWSCSVDHLDGRRWRVHVQSVSTGTERAESCAKGPVPLRRWECDVVAGPA